jgi:hypothetical protein
MNCDSTDVHGHSNLQPQSFVGAFVQQNGSTPSEELKEVLGALAIPFDLAVIQWRITEYSADRSHGLMLPYADPRAYSDRLNDIFTPAGWSRKYAIQASAPVQRVRRGPAAKILVTCEVTIRSIGTNSGTGEEWSDKENALTAAEAQAFKRSLSCFGLGRYLYDIDGEWVALSERGLPTKIPKLPRWATPNGWLAGLRSKPRRNRRALIRANGHAVNGGPANDEARHDQNGRRQSMILAVQAMESKIGKRFYRGLLKKVARVWSPGNIQELAMLEKVLAQMQGAERGIARLDAAQAKLAPEIVQRIISTLNSPPAKLEDLQTLHTLVVALEDEADEKTQA